MTARPLATGCPCGDERPLGHAAAYGSSLLPEASGQAYAVEALPLALTGSQRHVAGLDPLHMAVLEKEIAPGGNAARTRMIGRLGRATILRHDPLDARVQQVGGMRAMALEAIDEDGGRGELSTELLAVMPVAQTIGVVIPSPITRPGRKK